MNNALLGIDKILDQVILKERKRVALRAYLTMQAMMLNLKVNKKLIEPKTDETLVEWMEKDMVEFKKNYLE